LALGRSGGADLRKNAECRLAHRQLVELGVEAADVLGAAVVAALHVGAAERQRPAGRLHGAELAGPFGGLEQVDVDLDVEDLLHTTDVVVAELLVRVEEGATSLDACRRVDDLVAVDTAAPAFDLVLWVQRQLTRPADEVALGLHDGILGELARAPQDLTTARRGSRAAGRRRHYAAAARRSTTFRTSICVNAWKSGSPPSGCSSARNQRACTVAIPSSPAPRTSS